jgi:hypothetical protein
VVHSNDGSFTNNKKLIKAEDRYGVESPLIGINGNWDIIDTELGRLDGFTDLTTVPIRVDGVVVAIEERQGSTVVTRTEITRDASGEVVSTSKTANGMTVISTYNKVDGELVSITKEVI